MAKVEICRCKYLLPCGYCDKYDIPCKAKGEDMVNFYNIPLAEDIKECDHDWRFLQECYDDDNHIFLNKYFCAHCGEIKYEVNNFQPNT